MGPIRIDDCYIPQAAKGIHKIEKVMLFKSMQRKYDGPNKENSTSRVFNMDQSGGYPNFEWKNHIHLTMWHDPHGTKGTVPKNVTYGAVLLDNGVVINVMPGWGNVGEEEFSAIGRLLLLSEGEEVEFVDNVMS